MPRALYQWTVAWIVCMLALFTPSSSLICNYTACSQPGAITSGPEGHYVQVASAALATGVATEICASFEHTSINGHSILVVVYNLNSNVGANVVLDDGANTYFLISRTTPNTPTGGTVDLWAAMVATPTTAVNVVTSNTFAKQVWVLEYAGLAYALVSGTFTAQAPTLTIGPILVTCQALTLGIAVSGGDITGLAVAGWAPRSTCNGGWVTDQVAQAPSTSFGVHTDDTASTSMIVAPFCLVGSAPSVVVISCNGVVIPSDGLYVQTVVIQSCAVMVFERAATLTAAGSIYLNNTNLTLAGVPFSATYVVLNATHIYGVPGTVTATASCDQGFAVIESVTQTDTAVSVAVNVMCPLPETTGSGLSTGVIVAIAIAGAAACFLTIFLIVFLTRDRRRKRQREKERLRRRAERDARRKRRAEEAAARARAEGEEEEEEEGAHKSENEQDILGDGKAGSADIEEFADKLDDAAKDAGVVAARPSSQRKTPKPSVASRSDSEPAEGGAKSARKSQHDFSEEDDDLSMEEPKKVRPPPKNPIKKSTSILGMFVRSASKADKVGEVSKESQTNKLVKPVAAAKPSSGDGASSSEERDDDDAVDERKNSAAPGVEANVDLEEITLDDVGVSASSGHLPHGRSSNSEQIVEQSTDLEDDFGRSGRLLLAARASSVKALAPVPEKEESHANLPASSVVERIGTVVEQPSAAHASNDEQPGAEESQAERAENLDEFDL